MVCPSGMRGVASACHDRLVALVWLLVAIALGIGEIFTSTFGLLMFAVGALAAAGAAGLGAPLAVQAIVFALVSALSLFGVRPALRRWRGGDEDERRFGVEAIEGSTAVVLERVDAEHGMIKIEGETWLARAYDATESFEPGDRVRVIEVKGATAMVWRE